MKTKTPTLNINGVESGLLQGDDDKHIILLGLALSLIRQMGGSVTLLRTEMNKIDLRKHTLQIDCTQDDRTTFSICEVDAELKSQIMTKIQEASQNG